MYTKLEGNSENNRSYYVHKINMIHIPNLHELFLKIHLNLRSYIMVCFGTIMYLNTKRVTLNIWYIL